MDPSDSEVCKLFVGTVLWLGGIGVAITDFDRSRNVDEEPNDQDLTDPPGEPVFDFPNSKYAYVCGRRGGTNFGRFFKIGGTTEMFLSKGANFAAMYDLSLKM